MNWFLLYGLLLKATLTSFNGPMSLPIIRDELVVNRKILTDRQLNAAVTTAQTSPGPMGIYVVSVGYFVDGIPGALAGYLAVLTPALLMIPLVRGVSGRVDHPRIRATLDAAVLASAGLIVMSSRPLANDAITGWSPALLAAGACAIVATTRIATIWILAAAGLAGVITALAGGTL